MKKKAKKPTEKKLAGPTLADKLPKNHGEWLELLIKNTIRAIGPVPHKSEKYLIDQKDRLIKQLEEWKRDFGLGGTSK